MTAMLCLGINLDYTSLSQGFNKLKNGDLSSTLAIRNLHCSVFPLHSEKTIILCATNL